MSKQPTERTAMVIPLKDGERKDFTFIYRGHKAELAVGIWPSGRDAPYVRIADVCRQVDFSMQPDPVAEAVQAETERCKRIIANDEGVLSAYAHARTRLIAAIDAPPKPEPVSEYRRGRRDQYARCIEATEGLRKTSVVAAIESVLIALRATEPTDAH